MFALSFLNNLTYMSRRSESFILPFSTSIFLGSVTYRCSVFYGKTRESHSTQIGPVYHFFECKTEKRYGSCFGKKSKYVTLDLAFMNPKEKSFWVFARFCYHKVEHGRLFYAVRFETENGVVFMMRALFYKNAKWYGYRI